MADLSRAPLLGRLAVHYKLIRKDQLEQVLADQPPEHRLGELMMEHGWVTQKQLDRLLQIQRDMLVKSRASRATESASGSAAAGASRAPDPTARPESARPANPPPDPPGGAGATRAPSPVAAGSSPPAAAPRSPDASVRAVPEASPPAGLAASTASRPAERSERLAGLLRKAVEAGASHHHIHAGSALRMRRHGKLETSGDAPLEAAACESMFRDALSTAQWEQLETQGQIDFAYTLDGVARFRCNVYRQQHGVDGVFRAIPIAPPGLEELGLPSTLARFTGFHQGMVLVTGPAGCGKSSTMAALLDIVNEDRSDHIITIEDPIEFLHASKRCLVNQRQVGGHTESFARALRAALREDPDVIGIGELRDLETVSLALTAAETGHFVLATLHTDSAIGTINRLVGVFPPNQQSQIRSMVSESLRGVVSQRLVSKADGTGRVPALEVMVVNKAIGNLIRENKTVQIHSILQTGAAQGMCLLDDSLTELVRSGTISADEARLHANDSKRFAGGR